MNLEITRKHVALAVLQELGRVLSPNHHAVLTLFYTDTETHTANDVALATGLTPEMARVTLKRLVDRELLDRVSTGMFQIPARYWYHSPRAGAPLISPAAPVTPVAAAPHLAAGTLTSLPEKSPRTQALEFLESQRGSLWPEGYAVLELLLLDTRVHTVRDIAKHLDLKPNSLKTMLHRYVRKGWITRVNRGMYQIPQHLWYVSTPAY